MVDVDNIIESADGLVPEPRAERGKRFLEGCPPGRALIPKRSQPERLHLNRLPDTRGDHQIADLRIHPGELHSGFSRTKKSVPIHPDAVPRAASVAFENR